MISELIGPVRRRLSKIEDLPLLKNKLPTGARIYSPDERRGYLKSQQLAQTCALEMAKMIRPGWTEAEVARLMEQWLRDHGVKAFFHKPFVWWGDRTRFVGVKNYWQYQSTARRLGEGEVYILDVAPVVEGFISDIGLSGVCGYNREFLQGLKFLKALREEIPAIVNNIGVGSAIWNIIHQKIVDAGYDNIHATYPFGVLGHRVHHHVGSGVLSNFGILNFGWQSYWEFTSRGLFGQLFDRNYEGNLDGLWAIEPHIGGPGFGMKFEEILVIENGQAEWLESTPIMSL